MFHVVKKKKDDSSDDEAAVKVQRTATDVQRYKLEKLLKNIDKPAPIPNPKKERAPGPPVQFVRNVVGSSAGAGSGEYHIYRNLRKREMVRLEYIEKKAKQDDIDREYADRVKNHKAEMEAKTAKKRAKRLRIKQRAKDKKNTKESGSSSEEDNAIALAELEALDREEAAAAHPNDPVTSDDPQCTTAADSPPVEHRPRTPEDDAPPMKDATNGARLDDPSDCDEGDVKEDSCVPAASHDPQCTPADDAPPVDGRRRTPEDDAPLGDPANSEAVGSKDATTCDSGTRQSGLCPGDTDA